MFYCSSSALCMLETKLCFILFKWKHTVCSRKIMAARYHVMKSVTSRLSLVLVRLRPDICVLLISSNSNAFLLSAFFLLCDKFISFILISECINNRINCNHFSQFLISCTRAWIVNFYFFGGGGRERERNMKMIAESGTQSERQEFCWLAKKSKQKAHKNIAIWKTWKLEWKWKNSPTIAGRAEQKLHEERKQFKNFWVMFFKL